MPNQFSRDHGTVYTRMHNSFKKKKIHSYETE